ncbi:MAG: MBL fold metallo-hydrolase [Deltaproteobacteria bacterium]|nr:MBL fold metallo-hydrolase [Deltaproteobacteria bacterium]
MSLFARDVHVVVLSSGSAGNCTYVGDGLAGVVIDCGISTKQVFARLSEAGLPDAPVDAVLVTHEHSDHVSAAAILARNMAKHRKPIPFFMTAGTARHIDQRCVPDGIELVEAGAEVRVKHLRAECFPVPHDTDDPVAWRVHLGGLTIGVVTDLGKPTNLVIDKLRSCDFAVVEFNHDEGMLMGGPYPYWLKQRIRSQKGHLSNRQAQSLLGDALNPRLKTIVLGHLSEENNHPALAERAARDAFRQHGVDGEVGMFIGHPRQALAPFKLRAENW